MAKHFFLDFSFVRGLRVDYLAPTIYLTDILVIVTFLSWVIFTKPKTNFKKYKNYLLLFISFVILNIVFAVNWQIAILKWLKYFEIFVLALYVYANRTNFFKNFKLPIFLFSCYTLILSILQIANHQTIGGVWWLLGERTFSTQTPGIALANFFGAEVLRPYATFSHPNSLAGFFLVIFFTFLLLEKHKTKLSYAISAISLVLVLMSFSQGALIALVIICILRKSKLIILSCLTISFLMLFVNPDNFLSQTIHERLLLVQQAKQIFLSHSLFGVGAGNFVLALPKTFWLLQPVHNILLLFLSEMGIVGLVVFVYAIQKLLIINSKLLILILVILLTGLVDHYWLTLQQNLLLFGVIIALCYTKR